VHARGRGVAEDAAADTMSRPAVADYQISSHRSKFPSWGRLGVVVIGVLSMLVGAWPSVVSASSVDAASTHAYFAAAYRYEQELLANDQASRVAVEASAAAIERGCPGVLKGAPPEPASTTPFAQRVGESKREDEQLSDLEEELGLAVEVALDEPYHQALITFTAAVRPLSWSNPTLTQTVDTELTESEERAARPAPNVCADMAAWVTSGYQTLSLASKALVAKREEESRSAIRRPTASLSKLFAPYEDAADKALTAKSGALAKQRDRDMAYVRNVYEKLSATIGIVHEREPTIGHPPAGAVVIGNGRTAAGGRYEVVVEPPESSGARSECGTSHRVSAQILTTEHSGISGCFSRSESSRTPMVNCNEGLLTIDGITLPGARSVRLQLSNGRQIISPVVVVPPGLGGPFGFYYQVVRGPTPIPVSMTELDAQSRPMRTFKLHRFVGCTKHLLKYLHGGIRVLARGRVPNGPRYWIKGEAYRFLGHIQFALKVEIVEGGGGGESLGGHNPKVFVSGLFTSCQPRPYAVIYGLLKAPGDTVLERVGGSLHPLHRAAIPAHLHAGGTLVYSAADTVPSELIVRNPAGKTIITENLSRQAKEAVDMCEGQAEGS
jgi:hypothetical protein